MPKDADRRDPTRPAAEQLEQEQREKFKTFFTTSVAQVPEEMIPRDESRPDRKHGLLARFFAKKEKEAGGAAPDGAGEALFRAETPAPPTGEIVLDGAMAREKADENLALARPTLEELTLELEEPPAPEEPAPQPEPAPQAVPQTVPQTVKEPEPVKKPAPQPPRKKQDRRRRAAARVPDQEDAELEKLKVMLETMGPQPAKPAPAPPPEEDREVTEQVGGFHFFGVGEDEAPRGETPPVSLEDTMSLELHEEDAPAQPPAPPEEPAQEAARPAAPAQPPEQPPAESSAPQAAEEPTAEPQDPEQAAADLDRTVASLTLRCALSGILALALVWAGLVYEGVLPAMAGLSPSVAPAAFLGGNLLLLAAAAAVSRSTMQEGLAGLVKGPSYDTMPALAAAAALVQAVAALLAPDAYRATTLTLMSGAAAAALFFNNLGTRLLAVSVRDGYKIAAGGVPHEGAYRAADRDLVRRLAPALEEKDPWILLSRPIEGDGGFLTQSFGPRAGEKKVQTLARVLLAAALAGGLWSLLTGKGPAGAAAALASVLCLGAPFSSTLVAGLAALRTQRTAGALGAVIPGWAAIEELNGIDTIQVDAGELFTPESAQLEDIRIFKGGRIDRAILYTASVLNQGCNTLSRLFRTIIADRTDILPPVKDFERHVGLGFSGWCGSDRILIGTRAYMEQEGIALPDPAYEARHSRDGELQVLYLAVSGNMYAMFVLRYLGGKHAARSLAVLQRENIRLLVTCQDPSLTAERIAAAYHLPDGLVTVLGADQCAALAPAVSAVGDWPCCMLHLKGFASLTGGLRAAQRARAAEGSGVAVQMVSAGFSAVIGLLLSYSGSIGTLSLLVVLMYQAAWSALGIAAAALKQRE